MATIVVNLTTEISESAMSVPYTDKQQTETQRNNETTLMYTMVEANGTTPVETEKDSHNETTVATGDTVLATTEKETNLPESNYQ